MTRPPYLSSGNKIGIVSTARKISKGELQPALAIISDWGFETVLGKTIGAEENQLAGSDEIRAGDFQTMLDDPEIRAILCARGGYGTVRMVDKLNFQRFSEAPKWIIGYSDITVLHAHIHSNYGIETIHATMPLNFEKNSTAALESLKDALTGKSISYQVASHPFNRTGNAKGILVGGNLSVLYSISGSVSDLNTDGKVLFLEDLDEYLYHVDRMLMQQKRSGKFENLAGLLLGGFTDMRDNEIPYGKTALEIIKEQVEEYDFPVAYNFPAGHVDDNRALFLGREIELRVEESSSSVIFTS